MTVGDFPSLSEFITVFFHKNSFMVFNFKIVMRESLGKFSQINKPINRPTILFDFAIKTSSERPFLFNI